MRRAPVSSQQAVYPCGPRPQDASDRVEDDSDEVEDRAGVPGNPVAVAGPSDRLQRPKRNTRVPGSHWTIVMQYNLTEVEEENQNLSILLFEVNGQYDEFFQDLLAKNVSMHSPVRGLEAGFRYEYVGLQQLVADYVGQTSDLTTLVSSTRQKRGLIDVGGQ
ncbi:hypothetical protein J6590_098780, partial [Homalodisca vitripennis]